MVTSRRPIIQAIAAIGVALCLTACGDQWVTVEASDLTGEWTANVEGNSVTATLETDGSVQFTNMPDGVFCAGRDYRVSEDDWLNATDFRGTWILDEEFQEPGSMPLAFRDSEGCWTNAYVVSKSGDLAIRLIVGPPTEGSTTFLFGRSG